MEKTEMQIILEEIRNVEKRLENRLERIEEHTEVTRGAVNSLIEWADTVGVITKVKFPIAK